jgi:hypothetical protein
MYLYPDGWKNGGKLLSYSRLFVARHKKEGGQKALELRSRTMSWEERARGCEGWDSRVK